MNTNTITSEVKIYVTKLEKQINTITQIENIGYGDLISDDISKQLQKIKNDAIRYKRKLEKGEFEIAIVGLEKAGKSTFANAIIDNEILPRDDIRCTFTKFK